jgi:phage shock protein A
MTTVEQKLDTLTEQVADLDEQIRQLRARAVYTDALLNALLAPAQTDATRHRRRHLHSVGHDTT